MPKIRVFADTNVILESFRTGCWAAISNHSSIETVEKCVEETLTGNPGDSRHVAVPSADLTAGPSGQHPVNRKELASLVLSNPSCTTLDDGEKHLFAWLAANKLLPSQVSRVGKAQGYKLENIETRSQSLAHKRVSQNDFRRQKKFGHFMVDFFPFGHFMPYPQFHGMLPSQGLRTAYALTCGRKTANGTEHVA